ncbi:EAL domain-containing protein [Jeotgalibacillus malaysiensis]|uniref:EAL domain-containing protein n=1 Tax=Jeotgalibacillus malaysiensis TaxID=1508404 RepID=UPI0038514488
MNIAYFSPRDTVVKANKNTPFSPDGKRGANSPASVSALKLSFSDEVKRAMRADEFKLYYQPQINVKTGELFGAEALIRWHHPDRGVLYPDSFIPQAEYSGQIIDIERWTLGRLFRQQSEWQERGEKLTNIALNISGNHFVHGSLVTETAHLTHSYQVDPAFITLELTERMNTELDIWVSQVSMLQDIGIKISVDDFGTGFNTMAHLVEVDVDFLKIDQSFIKKMALNNRALKVVQSLVQMAETLGAVPVAEGIESRETLELYQQTGGEVVQGYHYSQAIPAEEFQHKYLSIIK